MQLQAVLHIPLSNDAYTVDGDTLVIRLRAAKGDLSDCQLFYGDRVCMTEPIEVEQVRMEKIAADNLFDYYEGRIQSSFTRICYYFKLTDTDGTFVYYSEYGFRALMDCHRTQYFQFPYLRREDEIRVPEWTKSMVMYHIFPDSFADGRRQIACKEKERILGNGQVSIARNGGTLRGILENLDYLASLQVNCLYLNPIFQAASYHKYDTIDYFEIDPCFGDKKDLTALVAACHEKGIRVILDGVFNHCGSGFFAFQDVLQAGEQSSYKDWFYRLRFPIRYETPPNYEAFAYVKEMPKLNTANPEVVRYFCEVGRYWIREADIDGWRLDVANEVNHDFWREFRKAVRAEKEDVFLIGEIWEDSTAWLMGDQFDSTMNYSFSYICREFFAERSIGIREFDEKINRMNLRYQENVARMQMNFLDTHDIPRFLSYCKGDVQKLKLAVFFMMTAMGIPSVFYGDEREVMGTEESEYRSPMPWKDEASKELEQYFRRWIAIRRDSQALCEGNYRTLLVDEVHGIYAFTRNCTKEQVVVVLNMGEQEQNVEITQKKHVKWINLEAGEEVTGNQLTCPGMEGRVFKLLEELQSAEVIAADTPERVS